VALQKKVDRGEANEEEMEELKRTHKQNTQNQNTFA
jgi:hypothetical protein